MEGKGHGKGAGYSKRDLIINISVDVRMGKLSAPQASSWVDGIDQFSPGRQCGFSYGCRERDIIRHCCAFSCETGNRPSGAGKPLQQPAGITPFHHSLHNQTDRAADHTLTLLHSRSHQLPVTVLSVASRLPEPNKHTNTYFQAKKKKILAKFKL